MARRFGFFLALASGAVAGEGADDLARAVPRGRPGAPGFLLALLMAAAPVLAAAQAPRSFGQNFQDRTMRAECSFMGDAKETHVSVDRVVEDGAWAGPLTGLAEPPADGRYAFEVLDAQTKAVLYAQGFDCLLGEYETTAPALAGVSRTFRRALRFPKPDRPFLLVVEKRDRENALHALLTRAVDPAEDVVPRGPLPAGDETFAVVRNGDPHEKVDLVFLSEGYTAKDRRKFRKDCERAAGWLFGLEPYRSEKGRFNVWGVFRPSQDRGASEPARGKIRRTALGGTFGAFGVARYLLAQEGWTLGAMEDEAPCDASVILVNSKRYGGGGIYNDSCIATVDNERSRMVLAHEFGHAFAGLADEYYIADVAYNGLYPEGVEPLEPNLTKCTDRARLKWRDLLSPGIPVPTPWGKEEADALEVERQRARKEYEAALAKAEAAHEGAKAAAAIEEAYRKTEASLKERAEVLQKRTADLADKVGLFEGAGYASEGIYRPMLYCLMGTSPKVEYCRVCQRAIRRTVDRYSPP